MSSPQRSAAAERHLTTRVNDLERRAVIVDKDEHLERERLMLICKEIDQIREKIHEGKVRQRNYGPERSHLRGLGAAELTQSLLKHRKKRVRFIEEKIARVRARRDRLIDDIARMREDINNYRLERMRMDSMFEERASTLELTRNKLALALEEANHLSKENEEFDQERDALEATEEEEARQFLARKKELEWSLKTTLLRLDENNGKNGGDSPPSADGVDAEYSRGGLSVSQEAQIKQRVSDLGVELRKERATVRRLETTVEEHRSMLDRVCGELGLQDRDDWEEGIRLFLEGEEEHMHTYQQVQQTNEDIKALEDELLDVEDEAERVRRTLRRLRLGRKREMDETVESLERIQEETGALEETYAAGMKELACVAWIVYRLFFLVGCDRSELVQRSARTVLRERRRRMRSAKRSSALSRSPVSFDGRNVGPTPAGTPVDWESDAQSATQRHGVAGSDREPQEEDDDGGAFFLTAMTDKPRGDVAAPRPRSSTAESKGDEDSHFVEQNEEPHRDRGSDDRAVGENETDDAKAERDAFEAAFSPARLDDLRNAETGSGGGDARAASRQSDRTSTQLMSAAEQATTQVLREGVTDRTIVQFLALVEASIAQLAETFLQEAQMRGYSLEHPKEESPAALVKQTRRQSVPIVPEAPGAERTQYEVVPPSLPIARGRSAAEKESQFHAALSAMAGGSLSPRAGVSRHRAVSRGESDGPQSPSPAGWVPGPRGGDEEDELDDDADEQDMADAFPQSHRGSPNLSQWFSQNSRAAQVLQQQRPRSVSSPQDPQQKGRVETGESRAKPRSRRRRQSVDDPEAVGFAYRRASISEEAGSKQQSTSTTRYQDRAGREGDDDDDGDNNVPPPPGKPQPPPPPLRKSRTDMSGSWQRQTAPVSPMVQARDGPAAGGGEGNLPPLTRTTSMGPPQGGGGGAPRKLLSPVDANPQLLARFFSREGTGSPLPTGSDAPGSPAWEDRHSLSATGGGGGADTGSLDEPSQSSVGSTRQRRRFSSMQLSQQTLVIPRARVSSHEAESIPETGSDAGVGVTPRGARNGPQPLRSPSSRPPPSVERQSHGEESVAEDDEDEEEGDSGEEPRVIRKVHRGPKPKRSRSRGALRKRGGKTPTRSKSKKRGKKKVRKQRTLQKIPEPQRSRPAQAPSAPVSASSAAAAAAGGEGIVGGLHLSLRDTRDRSRAVQAMHMAEKGTQGGSSRHVFPANSDPHRVHRDSLPIRRDSPGPGYVPGQWEAMVSQSELEEGEEVSTRRSRGDDDSPMVQPLHRSDLTADVRAHYTGEHGDEMARTDIQFLQQRASREGQRERLSEASATTAPGLPLPGRRAWDANRSTELSRSNRGAQSVPRLPSREDHRGRNVDDAFGLAPAAFPSYHEA